MAVKELFIDNVQDMTLERGFIRCFQEQLLLYLRQQGRLTETQYRNGLKAVDSRSGGKRP